MKAIEFQGQQYVLSQAEDLWQFICESKSGEYTRYYGQVVFHTENGFVTAYADNLDNYWTI